MIPRIRAVYALEHATAHAHHPCLILYKMYNIGMKLLTTTNARKQLAALVDAVRESGDVFAIGRRNNPEVLIIKFPSEYNSNLSDITNINAYSESFSFLESEPDLYSIDDLKKRYV